VQAGFYYTLPYIVAAVASPIIGAFCDKFGYRATVINVGACMMILAHVMQMVTPDCNKCWYSITPYFFLGLSYATYAVVLWASIPYMVEARALGTAFGMVTLF